MGSNLGGQPYPLVVSTMSPGPRIEWPEEPGWAVVRIRQDLRSGEVSFIVEETSNREDTHALLEWLSRWRFAPPPPDAREPLEILLFDTWKGFDSRSLAELQRPKIEHTADPIYPKRMERLAFDGRVRLSAVYYPDGSRAGIRILDCTHPEFGAAAVQAWKHWRFEPARWRGEPVAMIMSQGFVFQPFESEGMRTLPGFPALPEHRVASQAGDPVTEPLIRRMAMPPMPLELPPGSRPRELVIGLTLSKEGRVTTVDTRGVPEEWRSIIEAAVRTWWFRPARLGEERIPWLTRLKLVQDETFPDLLRTANRPNNRIPREDQLDKPPVLITEIGQTFRPEGENPPEGRFADIEMLVSRDGLVAATRVLATNDPRFALHARSQAIYNVYEPGTQRRRTTPFWLRHRYTFDAEVPGAPEPPPASEPQ